MLNARQGEHPESLAVEYRDARTDVRSVGERAVSGRKRSPYLGDDGTWHDHWSSIMGSEDDGFSDFVDLRIDLHKAIMRLPTMQRLAMLKRLRDEPLTHAEEEALRRAKVSVRKWLK